MHEHDFQPSTDMLKKMLDATDKVTYTFDRSRRVIYANKRAREVLGINDLQVPIGAGESNHFDQHKYYDIDGNLLPYPKGSAVERALEGHETHDLMIEHRDIKAHKHKWIQISCIPIKDVEGNFEYGIMCYEDVSVRKSREDKLKFLMESAKILSVTSEFEKRLEEKAKLTIPTLADWCAIDIVNSDGTMTRKVLVHRDPKKIEWMKDFERKYPRKRGDESTAEKVIRTGTAEFTALITDEMIEALPDLTDEMRADIKSLQLSSRMVFPIGTPGKVFGALSVAYAESGRMYTQDDFVFFEEFSFHLGVLLENARLYEEIRKRDLSKDAFLAALSHELRNPLAPIKSAVELLRMQNKDEKLDGEIQVIEHQFDHMARLLNDLLDATRFIRGKITLDIQPLELTSIIKDVVAAIQPLVLKAGIKFQVNFPSDPLPFTGDKTRLEQALSNVLNNALKFTPKGGLISVDLHSDSEKVLLKVTDTGVGMTGEEMRYIFEPYYQSERVRESNIGLGVGLKLVYEILRLHGGLITAQSEGPNRGSTFTMEIPLRTTEVKAPEKIVDPAIKKNSSKRLLVVDDNKQATDGLVRLLTALGCSAEGLYSAKDALTYLENHEVDIVLLDIGMPEMNGYELVQRLRAAGHDKLPIIAVTGYGLEDDRNKAIQAGFTSHLTKPIGTRELHQILQGALV